MKGVVLVGFMGTGKTTVGRLLARSLRLEMVDTDDLIVRQAGKPITRIFAEDGEAAFREWETRVLAELAHPGQLPRVVATGGGIVLAEANWPLLRQLGDVVCLTADPECIWRRVGLAPDRPLLAGTEGEVRTRMQTLLAERQAAYGRADWQCATDRFTPDQIVQRILAWRESRKG
jgi:shikimate kinase